jgi:hypothetical protein
MPHRSPRYNCGSLRRSRQNRFDARTLFTGFAYQCKPVRFHPYDDDIDFKSAAFKTSNASMPLTANFTFDQKYGRAMFF